MDLLAYIASQEDALVLLQAAIKAHCQAMNDGQRLTTYSLNGRTFNWTGSLQDMLDAQEKMVRNMNQSSIAYIETRVR